MPLVSIVVPVYKVEKYLDRCVKSLVNQTLKDIEIILVDDGSPDRCPELCDEFSRMDRRIRVVHKKNGGLSSARNAGMAVARGKYIGFVDSDDDVEPDMYLQMSKTAEQEQVDFVMADYARIPEQGEPYLKSLDIDAGKYDKKKIIKDIYPSLIMGENIDYGPLLSVWHCLYRLEFLRRNSLLFDEDILWSEDNIFSAEMGYCVNSFYYMKGHGLYHYYQNPGTITTSYRKRAWDVYCRMNQHLHAYFDSVQDYDFSRQMNLHIIYYGCNSMGQTASLDSQERKMEIYFILNTKCLENALRKVEIVSLPVSFKLKIQLMLMKNKNYDLLNWMIGRR